MFFSRYRTCSAQVLGQRMTAVDVKYAALIVAHSNDATGALGEEAPRWMPVMKRFNEWKQIQTQAGRARAARANHHDVQANLGAVQPPLGPGNPILRSEVAAENLPQLGGPEEIGAGLEVNVLDNSLEESVPLEGIPNQPRRRRQRANTGSGNVRRNNRPRNDGATVHDEISEGRDQLGNLIGAMVNVAQAMAAPVPVPQPPAFSYASNPIAHLQSLNQIAISISQSMGNPVPQNINNQMMSSLQGLLNQFDAVNGLNQEPNVNPEPIDNDNEVNFLPV
jgi:hypothetical protein